VGLNSDHVYVARQPVFDCRRKVQAYELLFRSGLENQASFLDGDAATSRVISNSFMGLGIDDVTNGKPAYINFTRDLLLSEVATLLPPHLTVVEVLEDVVADSALMEALRMLRRKGYTIALDDYVAVQDGRDALLEVADIIKVDFMLTAPPERGQLVDYLLSRRPEGLRLLAEKVEDYENYQQAVDLGFSYFQGFFFARPSVLSQRAIPAQKASNLRMLQEIHAPKMDLDRLETVIKSDLSLVTNLLRYINSAAFPWSKRIDSVKQALMLLGEDQVRKWATVVLLSGMISDKPLELAVSSCVRGRMCEDLGGESSLGISQLDCFLVGSLSSLDAFLDVPLRESLNRLPLSNSVRTALLERQGPLADLLFLVEQYERGEWDLVGRNCSALGFNEGEVSRAYVQSLQWVDKLFSTGV